MSTRRIGWKRASLGDFMVARAGSVDPKKYPDEDFDLYSIPAHDRGAGGFDVVRGSDIGSSKKTVEPGDVMISKIVPHIRRSRVVGAMGERRQISSTEWITFRSSVHEPMFLRYFLISDEFHTQFMKTVSGVGGSLMRAQPARVKPIEVPVPPLDEQRRIVELLEDHLSRLNAATEYTRTAAHRLVRLAQASRQQAIDSLSSPMVPLSELVERIETGKSLAGTAPASDDEWGVIKVSAMTWGAFRPEENKRIPETQANPAYEIHEGDLLVSRANTSAYVGASVLVEKVRPRLLLSDKSLRLVPRSGVDAAWLNEVLQAPRTRQQISAMATGTKDSMRNISQRALLSVAVPDTPSAQQLEVLSAARAAADSARALSEAVDRAERRAEGLRRALLAAAFAGRLTDSQTAVDGGTAELAAHLEVAPV